MADKALQQQSDTIRLSVYDPPVGREPGLDVGQYMEQQYINCYPTTFKSEITYEAPQLAVQKRAGSTVVAAFNFAIESYGGASDNWVCLDNITVTQLYDVYVAAFFDASSSTIYIIQYRPVAGTTTNIGSITGANINDKIFLTEFSNGNSLLPAIAISYQAFDQSFGTGYYAISLAGVFTGASLTTITHTSFPANLATPRIITGPFQFLNGHLFIMTVTGYIYNSSLNSGGNPDVTTWNTNATVTASQYPDRGIGVFRYKHLLVAVGQNSIEFFSDTSNNPPRSPLSRTNQAFIKFGAFHPKLVMNIDDVLYWVAYGASGTIGIWSMEGYAPKKISTAAQDKIISATFATVGISISSYFQMTAVTIGSRRHLVLNGFQSYCQMYTLSMPSAGSSDTFQVNTTNDLSAGILCYSIEDKTWWGMSFGTSPYAYILPVTAYPSTTVSGEYNQYFFKRTNAGTGNDAVTSTRPSLFVVNPVAGSYSDANPVGATDPNPICFVAQTNTYWFQNVKRKRFNKISAVLDPIFQGGSDGSVYSIYIGYNRVGTVKAGTECVMNRLVPSSTIYRYYINNAGMGRNLSLILVAKNKDNMRLTAWEVDVQQMTS